MQALAQVLDAYERRIRTLPFEWAVVFGGDGNRLLEKAGWRGHLDFTDAELATMVGAVVTHCHPTDDSFSPSDFALAARVELLEIRAVGPDWTHSLRPPPEGWGTLARQRIIITALRVTEQAVYRDFRGQVRHGTMAPHAAQRDHWHEVWRRVSGAYGLIYVRHWKE